MDTYDINGGGGEGGLILLFVRGGRHIIVCGLWYGVFTMALPLVIFSPCSNAPDVRISVHGPVISGLSVLSTFFPHDNTLPLALA